MPCKWIFLERFQHGWIRRGPVDWGPRAPHNGELVYDPRRPISIYTRHGFSSSIAPRYYFLFFPSFSLMQGFLISSFFCFIAGFSLVRNGSPSKTKGEGRETLLGLMKVLGFCNSLFEGIFFRF